MSLLIPPQVGTIGLTESEAVDKYGADKITVYETNFSAMYFALTSRKQVLKCTPIQYKRRLSLPLYFALTSRYISLYQITEY